MGCGTASRKERMPMYRYKKINYIANLENDSTASLSVVQPLGVFGEPAFDIPVSWEFGKGKSWCILDHFIYFSGGREREKDFGVIVVTIQEKKGKLMFKRQMTVGRERHKLLALTQNNIYALGGVDHSNETAIAKCEMYDILEDSWSHIPDMPTAKYLFGAATVNRKLIYIFGGFTTSQEPKNSIECYDSDAKSWTTITTEGQTLEPKQGLLASSISGGSILVFGGESDKERIPTYIFDHSKKSLEKIAIECNLPPLCHDEGVPVVTNKNRVYVISPDYISYYFYNVGSKSWCSAKIKQK